MLVVLLTELVGGALEPESLQYDWIGENIYFVDKTLKIVGLCGRASIECAIIALNITKETLSEADDLTLALDPIRGYNFRFLCTLHVLI